MRRILSIILLIGFSLPTFGQNKDIGIVRSDTVNTGGNLKLIGIPVIFSTPETGFGFGGGGQLFLTGEKQHFSGQEIKHSLHGDLHCQQPDYPAGFTPGIFW